MTTNLTHYQDYNRRLIRAWLQDPEHYQARHLRPQDILLTYQPQFITQWAQFWTPLEAAAVVCKYLPDDLAPISILEPAAGIGHLLWPLRARQVHYVRAVEIDEECARLGQHLASKIQDIYGGSRPSWIHCDFKRDCDRSAGDKFNYVLSNPPYGLSVQWGEPYSALSQYAFLQLSVRQLKRGGQALFVVPANFETQMPASVRADLACYGAGTMVEEQLPGEFRMTDVRVGLYLFDRA